MPVLQPTDDSDVSSVLSQIQRLQSMPQASGPPVPTGREVGDLAARIRNNAWQAHAGLYDEPSSAELAMSMVGARMVPGVVQAAESAAVPAVEAAAQPVIRAYHGSPHDFERFDLSKIGTGEGAQAYGHGLYFAENPTVAQEYRDQLSGITTRVEPMEAFDKTSGWIGMAVDNRTGAALERKIFPRGTTREEVQQWEDSLKSTAAPGRMYEVAIKADPEHFLDWDKPLSEMSPYVRKKLADAWLAHPEAHANQTGGQIYESSRIVPGDYRDPNAASKTLRDAGIPGIKYLDQGSRAGGAGTSNYVVFDDKLIDIVKKYGISALGAFPVGSRLMFPVDHDPFAEHQ